MANPVSLFFGYLERPPHVHILKNLSSDHTWISLNSCRLEVGEFEVVGLVGVGLKTESFRVGRRPWLGRASLT